MDTIAAIATAMSEGSIGIIRISGPDAFKIANSVFRNKEMNQTFDSFLSHTIHYGFVVNGDEIIDEVMISKLAAPNTFTMEDVAEINCHGGILVCHKVLDVVLNSGARLAEPGEFTKRAFLNGRIDLSQAEAVMELIASQNSSSLSNSLRHLRGNLFDKIKNIRESILYETAYIESAIDDPEHFDLSGYPDLLKNKVLSLKTKLLYLCDSFSRGKLMREGIKTVIAGRPNVGKSSLLNLLSGSERAIVTEIAGTTRDSIETDIYMGEFSLHLIDTAGIRNTDDYVENIGVSKAKDYLADADLVLFVINSNESLSKEDIEISKLVNDKNVIVLLNKCDLESRIDKDLIGNELGLYVPVISFSAKEGIGVDELKSVIKEIFNIGALSQKEDLVITVERQANELRAAISSLDMVINSIDNGLPEDFYTVDLCEAYACLGKIIGEQVDDDLVEEIFGKFCMGK